MLFIIKCEKCGKWSRETATRVLTPCACPPVKPSKIAPWIALGLFVLAWMLLILYWTKVIK